MSMNEADTRYHLIDPVLRAKGYVSRDQVTLETVLTPPPVEPTGPKGRRRKGPGRTDYLLCVQIADMPKSMPIAVLEAKKEGDDPLKGMQQAGFRSQNRNRTFSPGRPISISDRRTASSVSIAWENEASEYLSVSETRQGPANASTKLKTGDLPWNSLYAADSRYLLRNRCLMNDCSRP